MATSLETIMADSNPNAATADTEMPRPTSTMRTPAPLTTGMTQSPNQLNESSGAPRSLPGENNPMRISPALRPAGAQVGGVEMQRSYAHRGDVGGVPTKPPTVVQNPYSHLYLQAELGGVAMVKSGGLLRPCTEPRPGEVRHRECCSMHSKDPKSTGN